MERCYILLRPCHDVPRGKRRDIALRRLGEVPSRRRWLFHFRCTCSVTGTYRETSLPRHHKILLLVRVPPQPLTHFVTEPRDKMNNELLEDGGEKGIHF